MSDFERDDFDITPELLANFSTDEPYQEYSYEEDEKSIEQIREERFRRQEQRRLNKIRKRRSAIKNYFMPLAALIMLVSTVLYMNSLQFGLVVSYKNEQLGVVENADVLKEATGIIDSRIINKSLDSLEAEPQYKVAIVKNGSEFKNSSELSQKIISKDTHLEDEVCGIFVDDEFIGAAATEEEAEEVLYYLLENRKRDAANLGTVKSVEFNSSVVSEVGLYAKDSVVDKTVLKDRLVNNVDISYKITVLEEQQVKIRYKTEYKADASKPSGYEKVTTKGVLGEGVATNETVYIDDEKISSEHVKVVATKKPVNQVVTVSPDSPRLGENDDDDTNTDKPEETAEKKPEKVDTKTNTDTDSDLEEKDNSKSENVSDTNTSTNDNTDTDKPESSESSETQEKSSDFIVPTIGYITGEFGYEGESFHKGMDIGAGEGTPIVASAAGVVTNVVFDYSSEGLGCYITIDHGNGYTSTYAQCSDIYAEVGQTVEQGQTIAAVGSTGDSTGPHLHFRMMYGGEYVNPANYLY
ncbi:MAG: peptidoglycan DD-metalloendopeptidase family protein [Clostridia bacterium]|nr:peptidoglycan DD-metalloendopeptidase family protein [Clostridia bacterium]